MRTASASSRTFTFFLSSSTSTWPSHPFGMGWSIPPALLHAWSAHLRAVVERDAPLVESILDGEREPLAMPKRGDLK